MKDRENYMKEEEWRKKREQDKFISPGPGVYETWIPDHVGTALINQKTSFSKVQRNDP